MLSMSGGLLAACGGGDDEEVAKQLKNGTIKLGGYPDWIGADNLQPWKGRILLRFGLAKTNDPDELQRLFDTY